MKFYIPWIFGFISLVIATKIMYIYVSIKSPVPNNFITEKNVMSSDHVSTKRSETKSLGDYKTWQGMIDSYLENMNTTLNSKHKQESIHELTARKDYNSTFYQTNVIEEINSSLMGSPVAPLPYFKTPCWLGKIPPMDTYNKNPKVMIMKNPKYKSVLKKKMNQHMKYLHGHRKWRLRCLPSVILIGTAKCGTSDVSSRLLKHPDIHGSIVKEMWYWNSMRIGSLAKGHFMTFSTYLDCFDLAAEDVLKSQKKTTDVLNTHLIYEDTPHYLEGYGGWPKIPGNTNLSEPQFILAHTLREIQPNTKFLVMLRNPTNRFYSQFRMNYPQDTTDYFHELAIDRITKWKTCLEVKSIRGCTYTSNEKYMVLSKYHVFLEDWFKVFSRERFHIVKSEDYYQNTSKELDRIHTFLGLEPVGSGNLNKMTSTRIVNSNKGRGGRLEPMQNKTRMILNEFYAPFNAKLAKLLKDDRFLWKD